MEEQTMLGAFIRLVDNLFCEKLIQRVVSTTEELLQLLSTNTQLPGGAGKWQQAGPGRWTLAGSGMQVRAELAAWQILSVVLADGTSRLGSMRSQIALLQRFFHFRSAVGY
jgi:hypothetical protein